MAESEVKSAAKRLGKLLVEQIIKLDGVRDKVEELRTELETLAAFLIEAVRTRHQDEVVRKVISDARDVAYDCEDVIDTYILKVARHGYDEYEVGSVVRWAFLAVNAVPILKIYSKIGKLNKRIAALKGRMTSYGIPQRMNNTSGHLTELPRRFYSHEREEDLVVGFERQVDELVERLVDPNDKTVIAICGMGGIGKSTLAREIYHHPLLRDGGYFESFGWATASRQMQPDEVLNTLIHSLVPHNERERRSQNDGDINATKAHAMLYNQMKKEKCLVVIDDIWTSNDWAKLEAAFPRKKALGSRIILTTRNEETVSRLDQAHVYLHPVEALDETKSWELFEMTTFPGESSCIDSKKEELGREMLQHCKGVPLAIVVLAKVLQRKQQVEDWIQLRTDISSQIQRGGAPGLYREVYDVLQVSYDELPYHLKNCFLHLANFPEDYEIWTEKLYQLWVCEGIVSKEDSDELEEDIAERCLNDLVSRSMVQVASWILGTQRIESCSLHDLMRDVCIDISKREGFVQTFYCNSPMLLNNNSNASHLLMTSVPERDKRLRRIAVNVSNVSDQEPPGSSLSTSTSSKVLRAPKLRSLLLFIGRYGQQQDECGKLVETISNDFPLLRLLDCERLNINGELPKKVSNLIHLKYLGLAYTGITKLPSSIQKLQWLQTLDLRIQFLQVLSLPNILWKMKQLRHVYLPESMPLYVSKFESGKRYSIEGGGLLRLDGLCNLQTLMHIDLDTLDLEGLIMLKNRLKMVSVSCGTNGEGLDHLLHGSSSMKSCTLTLHGQILNQNPTILSICEATCDLIIHAVLERLPKLADLGLHMCYDGQKMASSSGGFPQLIDLFFEQLDNFSDWEVEQGAFMKLKRLRIYNCPVNAIPDALPSSLKVTRSLPAQEGAMRIFLAARSP